MEGFFQVHKGQEGDWQNQFTKLNMKKVSWIAAAGAWPEQQQDCCTCWTMAGIPCLALIHQLRETWQAGDGLKEGHQHGQSAAEPAIIEGIVFVQPRENLTQTFQHLEGAQRGDGNRNRHKLT